MINIILTPDEVAICQILGRMRSLIARSSNVKDAKIGKQDGSDADVLGVMAEYAFAKHFNVFPDLGLSPRSGSADGIYKGWRYDIKSILVFIEKNSNDCERFFFNDLNIPNLTTNKFV